MSSLADELLASRDLLVVGVLVGFAIVAVAVGTMPPVRLPFTVLLLLILPGYVTAAFAYAEREREPWTFPALVERFALSLGGSLAVLPLLALLLSLVTETLTRWGFVAIGSAYIILVAGATVVRRARRSDTATGRGPAVGSRGGGSSLIDRLADRLTPLTVVLAVSMLLGVTVLGAAVTVPVDGESATDLHLLTEQDGELVANEYPETLTEGESATITIGVTNDEHRSVEYTAVTEVQRVEVDGRSIVVTDKRRVEEHAFELAHGETWRTSQSFDATLTGENVRFVTYLYRGDPPENPTAESAYRTTYVWVEVQPDGVGS